MNWHVLYLRPRCEKKVAERCRTLGLEHYLPLRRHTAVYQRRRVTVDKPVFPGYFFVSFDAPGRLALLKLNMIVRDIEPVAQEQFLHELAQVRQALTVDPTLGTCSALKTGRRVRILGGPFMGIEGLVSATKGLAKVRLNVEMVGQAVVLEVERELLEVVE